MRVLSKVSIGAAVGLLVIEPRRSGGALVTGWAAVG